MWQAPCLLHWIRGDSHWSFTSLRREGSGSSCRSFRAINKGHVTPAQTDPILCVDNLFHIWICKKQVPEWYRFSQVDKKNIILWSCRTCWLISKMRHFLWGTKSKTANDEAWCRMHFMAKWWIIPVQTNVQWDCNNWYNEKSIGWITWICPPLWGQSFWVNIDIFKYTSLLCERLVFSVQKYTDKEYRCNKYQECGNSHCKQNSDNLHPSGTVVMKREDLLYV